MRSDVTQIPVRASGVGPGEFVGGGAVLEREMNDRPTLATPRPARSLHASGRADAGSTVLACLDRSRTGEAVLAHAAAVAPLLGASLTLFHVVDPRARSADGGPTDPYAWEIRLSESREYLSSLAESLGESGVVADVEVAQGNPSTQIRAYARGHVVDLVSIATHGEGGPDERCLGGTARKLIEGLPCSLLLVPTGFLGSGAGKAKYTRILVPLDGSPRAESVLPLASTIARADGAELLLLHAVPTAALTRVAPPSVEDLDLERRLRERNSRVGEAYLTTLSARLAERGVGVRVLLLEGDDPRASILRAAQSEGCDLVVASSHGATSSLDRPCGSVASHLAERSPVPILLVRETLAVLRAEPAAAASATPRLPGLELPEGP